MENGDERLLQLSGLQHFAFCRRQWALIHIEDQWAENYRTTDGALMHEKAHDSTKSESRGNLLIRRGVRIVSQRLGVSGECDVLEFHRSPDGITLTGKDGLWRPFPVEYKRGRPGVTDGDKLQLCGQAMCLEEMLCCEIPQGALYYGETRHREPIEFTPELRQQAEQYLKEMHDYYDRGYTPKVKPKKGCNSCSLKEICLPKLMRRKSVESYVMEALNE